MFACAPPAELPKRMPKQRTPLQLYIRYLLFDCLDNSRTQQNLVLRAFKALPMKSDPVSWVMMSDLVFRSVMRMSSRCSASIITLTTVMSIQWHGW